MPRPRPSARRTRDRERPARENAVAGRPRLDDPDPAAPGARSGSSRPLSSETCRCICVTAVTGGSSPYTSSARRSIDTTRFASSSRSASTEHCHGPPSRIGPDGDIASSSPRMGTRNVRRPTLSLRGGGGQPVARRGRALAAGSARAHAGPPPRAQQESVIVKLDDAGAHPTRVAVCTSTALRLGNPAASVPPALGEGDEGRARVPAGSGAQSAGVRDRPLHREGWRSGSQSRPKST